MKKYTTIICILYSLILFSQIGINTSNPQGVFNIDAKSSIGTINSSTGLPSPIQGSDDFIVTSKGSVGIGTLYPDESAILDINVSNASDKKGLLLPRVDLTSSTMKLSSAVNAISLLVYNIGTVFPKGLYSWDGSKWLYMEGVEIKSPQISKILCNSAILTPATYTSGVNYQGILRVPYYGGNGANYSSGNILASLGVTGLNATLNSGRLENGNGELVFTVTGSPSASSPSTAVFPIPSLFTAPGCNINVGDYSKIAIGETKSVKYSAPMNIFNVSGPTRTIMNGKNVNNTTTTNKTLLSVASGQGSTSSDLVINGLMMDFLSDGSTLIIPTMRNLTNNAIQYSITTVSTYGSFDRGVKTTVAPNAIIQNVDKDGNEFLFEDNTTSEFLLGQIIFQNGEWYQFTYTAFQIDQVANGYITVTRIQ